MRALYATFPHVIPSTIHMMPLGVVYNPHFVCFSYYSPTTFMAVCVLVWRWGFNVQQWKRKNQRTEASVTSGKNSNVGSREWLSRAALLKSTGAKHFY